MLLLITTLLMFNNIDAAMHLAKFEKTTRSVSIIDTKAKEQVICK